MEKNLIGEINEVQLFKRLIENDDTRALERIYLIYEEPLSRYAFQFIKSRFITDEIIQDVFFQLWLHRKKLQIEANIRGYLFRMVRNKSLNYIRDAVEHEDLAEVLKKDALVARGDQPDDHINSMDYDDLMESVLGKLPARKRDIYQLSRFHNVSNTEIARRLGINIRTVENHISDSLRILRKYLKKHLYLILAILTIS